MSQSKNNEKRKKLTLPGQFIREENWEMANEDQLLIGKCIDTGRAISKQKQGFTR